MGTSPPANVLVGLSTWFWVDGWDGEPISVPVVAPWGSTVMVELSLGEVRWDFVGYAQDSVTYSRLRPAS